jgi:hypothetical protein
MAAAALLEPLRELAHRVSGGVEVTLYWSADDNGTSIEVWQHETNETLAFPCCPSVRSTPSTTRSRTCRLPSASCLSKEHWGERSDRRPLRNPSHCRGAGRFVEHRQVLEQVPVGVAEVDGGGRHPGDHVRLVRLGLEERERRHAKFSQAVARAQDLFACRFKGGVQGHGDGRSRATRVQAWRRPVSRSTGRRRRARGAATLVASWEE